MSRRRRRTQDARGEQEGTDLHQAAHKVGGGVSFARDQALPELGEATVSHHGQRRADLLRDTHTHTHTVGGQRAAPQLQCNQTGRRHVRSFSQSSRTDLDVSCFSVPVLKSRHAAVLLQQAAHGAFYQCDTGGRNNTMTDISVSKPDEREPSVCLKTGTVSTGLWPESTL